MNDGGRAFPSIREFYICGVPGQEHMTGMTLRDYFASKVVGGVMANPTGRNLQDQQGIAELCYAIADAMLEERAK